MRFGKYFGNYMFVWVGAAVDIPYRVHKLLASLGPKLYFFRLPYSEKSDLQLFDCLNENFEKKRKEIEQAVIEYLKWFELCPDLIHDEETALMKIHWNSGKDDFSSKDCIIKLAKLLGRLRGHVDIWSTRHATAHNHEYSEYDYGYTQTEDPARASTQLYNLARGHALLSGRNHILLEDIHLVVKVVLSTASVERVAILDLLLAKRGTVTLPQIAKSLPTSKSTALKAMTELTALKVVSMSLVGVEHNFTQQISITQEFSWLLREEFAKLREGFKPVDDSAYDQGKGEEDPVEEIKRLVFLSQRNELAHNSPDGWVRGTELQQKLVSSGKFFQSDARLYIDESVKSGMLEAVPGEFDVYRKVERDKEDGAERV